MSTTEKTPAATDDPFADLFDGAVIEDTNKKKRTERPEWTGPIDPRLDAMVKKAAADGGRVVLPCKNVQRYDDVLSMAATVARTEAPDKVVYGTARHDKAGAITHVTFTVGEKRGRKSKEGDDQAPNDVPTAPAADAADDAAPVKPAPEKAAGPSATQSTRKSAAATNK